MARALLFGLNDVLEDFFGDDAADGAVLEVYINGTSDPNPGLTADITGLVELGYVFPLSESGRLTTPVYADGLVRIRLVDRLGAQVFLQDNFAGSGGGSGGGSSQQSVFQRTIYVESASQPPTPVGSSPSGWSNTPPINAVNTIWASTALVTIVGQNLIGTWSTPVAWSGASISTLRYYIKAINGSAIKNGIGTLRFESRVVDGTGDNLAGAGDPQLYVGTTLIAEANGFPAGSNGAVAILGTDNINGSLVVEQKLTANDEPLDTVVALDVVDGSATIQVVIDTSEGSAFTRLPDSGEWSDLVKVYPIEVYQSGALIEEAEATVTLSEAEATLSAIVSTSNPNIAISFPVNNARNAVINAIHTPSNAQVSETIITVQGGSRGIPGETPVRGELSPDVGVFNSDSSGANFDLSNFQGVFKVFDGRSQVNASAITFSARIPTNNGLTVSINSSGIFTLSGPWSADTARVGLRAVYDGVTVDLDFVATKVRNGEIIGDVNSDAADAYSRQDAQWGAVGDITFVKNANSGSLDPGEIRVTAGRFFRTDGQEVIVNSPVGIGTPFEGSLTVGQFFVFHSLSGLASSRFGNNFSTVPFFVAVYSAGIWQAVPNNNQRVTYTPLASDTMLAFGSRPSTATQGIATLNSLVLGFSINAENVARFFEAASIGSAQISELSAGKIAAGVINVAIQVATGEIQLLNQGKLFAGRSTFGANAAGIFLGYDAGVPKFYIGNANGTRSLQWNGQSAIIQGGLVVGAQVGLIRLYGSVYTFFQPNFPGSVTHTITIGTNGFITGIAAPSVVSNPTNANTFAHQWLRNSNDSSQYSMRLITSDSPTSGSPINTWLSLGTSRAFTLSINAPSTPTVVTNSVRGTLQIRDNATSILLAEDEFNLFVSAERSDGIN